MTALHEVLEDFADVSYVVLDLPSTRHAEANFDVPADRHFVGSQPAGTLDMSRRILFKLTDTWSSISFHSLHLPAAIDIVRSREIRRLVRGADVLDFQWMEWARLSFLRWLNPRAVVVVTLHDVVSQLALRHRDAAPGRLRRWRWEARRRLVRMGELRVLHVADRVIVFSDKDAGILDPGQRHRCVEVVAPPLAVESTPLHQLPEQPRVLFIGYLARPENIEALGWLVSDIWPSVHARHPMAELDIVGDGLPLNMRGELDRRPGVRVRGFVKDLEDAYRSATVAVVPLRSGAGVKFKVIEAMLRGVPVVTTPVGAEGIASPDRFAGFGETADQLVDALDRVLSSPQAARRAAAAEREWAMTTYSSETFRATIRRIYGCADEAQGGSVGFADSN